MKMKNEYLETARLEGAWVGHCLRKKMHIDAVDAIRNKLIFDVNRKDANAVVEDLKAIEDITDEKILIIDRIQSEDVKADAWNAMICFCNATGRSSQSLSENSRLG